MSINLLDTLKQNLGYGEVSKIDPNTQEVSDASTKASGHDFAQAAIPATLLALYKYGNTEQGAQAILRGNNSTDWLSVFFDDKKDEAIRKIGAYSNTSEQESAGRLQAIAEEAVKLIRQQVPENASFATVKSFVNDQRTYILKSLPAELQMGYLLNDNTVDDRTHKMSGPMSDHMHFFEKLFSGSTTEKNERLDD